MGVELNTSQKEALSDFFNNIAVAWFIALFATPALTPGYNSLTLVAYSASMVFALGISLLLRKDSL